MHLSEYPQAIAHQQRRVKATKATRDEIERQIARLKNSLEKVIAFDKELKNEPQRKTGLFDLMEGDTDLQKALSSLTEIQESLTDAEIELTLLLNQFTLEKLFIRQEIATLESQNATN